MTATCEVMLVPGVGTIDAVTVYWRNIVPGKGEVTLTCWGSAWTCYFGGMGDNTIQQFFAMADVSYLVNKLGISQVLKQDKRSAVYLGRVIETVKAALKAEAG